MRYNLLVATSNQKKKWEHIGLKHGYCLLGVTTIPLLGYGIIIRVDTNEDNSYQVFIVDMLQCLVAIMYVIDQ